MEKEAKDTAIDQKNGETLTALQLHGKLSVRGTDLVDEQGEKVQLKGVSTLGICWYPQLIQKEAFATLNSWGTNLIRLAMYTFEEGGYLSDGDKAQLEETLDIGVKACTELGMYVILDWHILSDGNPLSHQAEAMDFFDRMSRKYAGLNNVIYEICNEPNPNGPEGNVTWDMVRTYANAVIPVIRRNDQDAVILVGTPTWSQDVDQVAAAPVDDTANVMYVLHFYAGTHKDDLRRKAEQAISDGTPVFISEFSICDASGNGEIDYESAEAWKKLIQKYGLSYAGWNLSVRDESSAILKPDTKELSDWSDEQLTETGRWLKKLMEE